MNDLYGGFARSPFGKAVVRNLGLPDPIALERFDPERGLVDGLVLLGGSGRLNGTDGPLPTMLADLGIQTTELADGETSYRGLVFDATGITSSDELSALQAFFTPVLRRLTRCARVLVIGTPPELTSASERVAQRSLEGFTRSLGKEIGRGGTVHLVYVAPGAEQSARSTLGFFLSAKSAYVSGQVVRIGSFQPEAPGEVDWLKPLAGQVALVTGASRGIGAEVARVLHRDGARVIGLDVPQAASDLQTLMGELDGGHLTLNITAADAPKRIAQHLKRSYGGVDIVVHNAGITRDKRLRNMDADRWDSVISVNLTAPERITRELLDQELLGEDASIVGVASIAGIAGNTGQTNYATSKAGVIGLVDSLAGDLTGRRSVNAVAPGFIETKMTAAVPFATREVGRRLNAMSQGGLPIDVAETVSWLAAPSSGAVSGNVVRVCGQMILGA